MYVQRGLVAGHGDRLLDDIDAASHPTQPCHIGARPGCEIRPRADNRNIQRRILSPTRFVVFKVAIDHSHTGKRRARRRRQRCGDCQRWRQR